MPRKAPSPRVSLPDDLKHGGLRQRGVTINGYSLQLHDGEGFVGDSVSRTAYSEMLDTWRKLYRRISGLDALGRKPTPEISKKAARRRCSGATARPRPSSPPHPKTTPGS
jgi:hypothetical protein